MGTHASGWDQGKLRIVTTPEIAGAIAKAAAQSSCDALRADLGGKDLVVRAWVAKPDSDVEIERTDSVTFLEPASIKWASLAPKAQGKALELIRQVFESQAAPYASAINRRLLKQQEAILRAAREQAPRRHPLAGGGPSQGDDE